MAVKHTITRFDSLQSLALKYLDDATLWKQIADYNKLDYPYIVSSEAELSELHSKGYVTVVRRSYTSDLTVPKGWQFETEPVPYSGNAIKYFEVIEDTTIPAGISTWDILCQCITPGTFGNVAEYTISRSSSTNAAASSIAFATVYNKAQFTGGKNYNVKVVGDTIYIPADSAAAAPEDIKKMLNIIGGTDLLLDTDGDIQFSGAGDLASVTGADNIRYAVRDRIATDLGEYTLHPEYGTDMQDLIASANIANRTDLIELAILNSLNQEDRITDVSVEVAEDEMALTAKITYVATTSSTTDSISVPL